MWNVCRNVDSPFRSPFVCNELYALYILPFVFYCFAFFFYVLRAEKLEYHGMSVCAPHSDLFIVLCSEFWILMHFGLTPCFLIYKQLKACKRRLLTLTNTCPAGQLGLLLHQPCSDGLGDAQCQCMPRVPEGVIFCFLVDSDSRISFLGLLLTCAGSVAEMWDPVQQFSPWKSELINTRVVRWGVVMPYKDEITSKTKLNLQWEWSRILAESRNSSMLNK